MIHLLDAAVPKLRGFAGPGRWFNRMAIARDAGSTHADPEERAIFRGKQ